MEDMTERQRKDELMKLLAAVLENSNIIPFRWYSNNYMCFYCCCPFLDSSKLKAHMIEEHHDAKVTKTIRSSLKSCRIKLDVSDISCKLCPKKVHSFDDFLSHILENHDFKFNRDISRCIFVFKLNDELLSCCYCAEKFKFFGSLLRHVHKYHNRSGTFLCELCGQGFVGKANVDSHIRNVHLTSQIPCSKCDMTFPNNSALIKHKDQAHKDRLKCPKCPEVLASMYMKQRHLAMVHDVKNLKFTCDQCPQVFMKNSSLVHHKSRVHLKEKTVTCDICGFKVFNKSLLMRHMVRHNDSRPFECDFCKKTFQRKKGLDLHRRIHTNDKRYACKMCDRAFVQWTSLKLHLKSHHTSN